MAVNDPHPLPTALREAVRTATYPNSTVEAEAIADVEARVRDRLAPHELNLIARSHAFIESARTDLDAADEIETALRREIRFTMDEQPEALNGDLAKRYAHLKGLAEKAIAELERADRQAEWLANRLENPLADLEAMLSKWPALRAGRRL